MSSSWTSLVLFVIGVVAVNVRDYGLDALAFLVSTELGENDNQSGPRVAEKEDEEDDRQHEDLPTQTRHKWLNRRTHQFYNKSWPHLPLSAAGVEREVVQCVRVVQLECLRSKQKTIARKSLICEEICFELTYAPNSSGRMPERPRHIHDWKPSTEQEKKKYKQ